MARLHELIGRHLDEGAGDAEVVIGIETYRGPWVAALIAAGYTVYPVNRCRRPGTGSGTRCGGQERSGRLAHARGHGAR
jgi:hypothetical protein